MIQLLVAKEFTQFSLPIKNIQKCETNACPTHNKKTVTSHEQSQTAHKFNFLIKMDTAQPSTFLGGLRMKNAGDKNQPKSVVQFPKSSRTIASGWEDSVLHEERRHDI